MTRTKREISGHAPTEKWVQIVDGWRVDREMEDEDESRRDTNYVSTALGPSPKTYPKTQQAPHTQKASPNTVRRIANAALQHPGVFVNETRWVKDVLLLRGMSALATGATVAHEYGHCYLFARKFPALKLKVEEGICELFAWLWLGGGASVSASTRVKANKIDEHENARRRIRMERRVCPVYGDGFRDAKKALELCGGDLWVLLEHVKRKGELPPESREFVK